MNEDRLIAFEGAVRAITALPPDISKEEFKTAWKEAVNESVGEKLIPSQEIGPERGLIITHENKKKKKIYLVGCDPAVGIAAATIAEIHSNHVVEIVNQREAKNEEFESDVNKLISLFDDKNIHKYSPQYEPLQNPSYSKEDYNNRSGRRKKAKLEKKKLKNK